MIISCSVSLGRTFELCGEAKSFSPVFSSTTASPSLWATCAGTSSTCSACSNSLLSWSASSAALFFGEALPPPQPPPRTYEMEILACVLSSRSAHAHGREERLATCRISIVWRYVEI